MNIPYSKERLFKENTKLMEKNKRLQQQMAAIKEAYTMSGHSFDEVCILVIEKDISGEELENKLVELRAYDKQINLEITSENISDQFINPFDISLDCGEGETPVKKNQIVIGKMGAGRKITTFHKKNFKKELAPSNASIKYWERNGQEMVTMTYPPEPADPSMGGIEEDKGT
ncbi:hypothetical protein Q5W88_21695 [Shouchella clausii]|uniref:hypothetical protein n=1 Tax=Shouchella clausii TaxID=79880 RepID=UPI0026F46DE8|nr:hypothetical protein [Shouchella clausii]MDO7285921.1 hypothetical protein [Shouchella clausii]MDO7305824.1 hypothetical protein [Shouchella clausii]